MGPHLPTKRCWALAQGLAPGCRPHIGSLVAHVRGMQAFPGRACCDLAGPAVPLSPLSFYQAAPSGVDIASSTVLLCEPCASAVYARIILRPIRILVLVRMVVWAAPDPIASTAVCAATA